VGVQFAEMPVRGPDDFAPALKTLRGTDGVLNLDNPLFVTYRAQLVDAVAGSRLFAIYSHRVYVEAGSLMTYDPSTPGFVKAVPAPP